MNYHFENYHYSQPNQLNNQIDEVEAQIERERRIFLRDQERQRRNMGFGDQGLQYGAAQGLPPQIIRPVENIQNQFYDRQFQNQGNDIIQRQSYDQSLYGQQINQQDKIGFRRSIEQNNNFVNESGYQPLDMNHLMRAQKFQSFHEEHQSENHLFHPESNLENSLRQSKSKLNLQQAQELDRQIAGSLGQEQKSNRAQNFKQNNLLPPKFSAGQIRQPSGAPQQSDNMAAVFGTQVSNQFLNIGQEEQLAQKRREIDKRQKQQEYQQFLDQQRLQKASQMIDPVNRLRSRDRMSSNNLNNLEIPQQPQQNQQKMSPNKSHRALVRSNSLQGNQNQLNQGQSTNILGQRIPNFNEQEKKEVQQNLQNQQNFEKNRGGSTARGRDQNQEIQNSSMLVAGGMSQIGLDPEQHRRQQLEEKAKKQREYREFLDMQKNQKIGGKPPQPPTQSNIQVSAPSSFIAQSTSVKDQHYLNERQKVISDQIFEQILKQTRPASQRQEYIPQPIVNSDILPVVNLQNKFPTEGFEPQKNFFDKRQKQEEEIKQLENQRKQQYFQELQNQIQFKQKLNESQLPPRSDLPPRVDPLLLRQDIQNEINYQYPQRQDPNQQRQIYEPQNEQQTSFSQYENDPVFLELLNKKREEIKQRYADQYRQDQQINYAPQIYNSYDQDKDPYYLNKQHSDQPTEQINYRPFSMGSPPEPSRPMPSFPQEIEQKNQNRDEEDELTKKKNQQEEYRRQLDDQMKQRNEIQSKKVKHEVDRIEAISRPPKDPNIPVVVHALPQPNDDRNLPSQKGVRARTDITSERQEESQLNIQKKLAYQEELRIQMEQQIKKKEEEKRKLKEEDERIERELEREREMLKNKLNKELRQEGREVKEGYDDIGRKKRQVNRAQFATSHELQEVAEIRQEQQPVQESLTEETNYVPFQINQKPEVYVPQQYQPQPQYQPQYQVTDQTPMLLHQKLVEEQQKMINMYQQALQQILDFRSNYFKEATEMQMNLAMQRDKPQQSVEMQSLQAVHAQLGKLMQQVTQNQGVNVTSIMNPSVQNNLNELIKTQRDKIVRMSQDIQQEGIERNDSFDGSLNSKSKFVRVPNPQFANKLKEKAQGFVEKRLSNSPQKRDNQYISHPSMTSISSNQLQPQLVQTWQQSQIGPIVVNRPSLISNGQGLDLAHQQSASFNDRDGQSQQEEASPFKGNFGFGQYNPQMQASLAGSSYLQYFQQTGQVNPQILNSHGGDRMISPMPTRQQPQSQQNLQQYSNNIIQSPQSHNQSYLNRPQTNILHDTIQEVPEGEQNYEDNTQSEQEFTMKVQNQLSNQGIKIQKQQQSEQVKNGARLISHSNVKPVLMNKKTIETEEQDFNCRDDELSQISKFQKFDQRSKASQISRPDSNAIAANLAFIENQVNIASGNYRNLNSNSKSPHRGVFSPDATQINNQIGSNTAKSFYKKTNINNSRMSQTGMQGAKPMATGSSFYNATMAKTKIQEMSQQEELQKQLQKIFNSEKDRIQYPHENEQSQQPSPFQQNQFAIGEDLDNESHINIAQSVDYKDQQYNLNTSILSNQNFRKNQVQPSSTFGQTQTIDKPQETTINSAIGSGLQTKAQPVYNPSQYNWLLQENQKIKEEELEQSKSKSKRSEKRITEEEEISYGESMKHVRTSRDDKQPAEYPISDYHATQSSQNGLMDIRQSKEIESQIFEIIEINQEEPENPLDNRLGTAQTRKSPQKFHDIYKLGMTSDGLVDYNLALDDNSPKKVDDSVQKNKISALNLMVNEYSEEPATALLIRNDTDFRMMQKLVPQDNGVLASGKDEIDQIYNFRMSQQARPFVEESNSGITPGITPGFAQQIKPNFQDKNILQESLQEDSDDIYPVKIKPYQTAEDDINNSKSANNKQSAQRLSKVSLTPGKQQSDSRENKFDLDEHKRPQTMASLVTPSVQNSKKLQELEDLAKLIQQAAGSVNNIVENSYQFLHTRQAERKASKIRGPLNNQSKASMDTILRGRDQIQISQQTSNFEKPEVYQKIKESEKNENQILSDLDKIIQNLEKQQQENINLQNKFTNNKQVIQSSSPKLKEELNYEEIKPMRPISSISHTGNTIQRSDIKGIANQNKLLQILQDSDTETQILQNQQEIKLQGQPRPISSNSYSRYDKSQKKQQSYEEYNEDD